MRQWLLHVPACIPQVETCFLHGSKYRERKSKLVKSGKFPIDKKNRDGTIYLSVGTRIASVNARVRVAGLYSWLI